VSVCLTHYERPDYLKVALRSIINQTYENTEIIVSDDGSASPQTLEVLKSIDENGFLGREIIVSYGDNSYLGTSRNRARLRASGEYILYMDDDNLAKENEIEAFVRIAQKNDADFVGSFMNVFHSNEPEPDLSSCNSLWGGLGEIHSGYYLENYFSDANGLYKRSSLDKLGGYSTEYGLGYEDWELFHRMKNEGMRIIVLPEAFYFYRVNTDDSMVKTVSDKESLLRVLRHSSNRENYVKDLLISGMLRTFPY
jgi:glycosyltransferase involved in cell wall biosynthesis